MLQVLITILSIGVTHGNNFHVKMNSELIGRTIHIESLYYRGSWLDAHHTLWAYFSGAAQKDVYQFIWSKFKVSYLFDDSSYK